MVNRELVQPITGQKRERRQDFLSQSGVPKRSGRGRRKSGRYEETTRRDQEEWP